MRVYLPARTRNLTKSSGLQHYLSLRNHDSNIDPIQSLSYRERFPHKLMKTMEEGYTQQGEFSSADTDEVIKRILIMDDNPDITLTFKKVLQGPQIDDRMGERHLEADIAKDKKKMSFEVITYNDPFLALSEFKPNFYHLMLVDINMPKINGFEFSAKILERDANPRICFMSSGQINQEALEEVYPTLGIGCFIKKPIMARDLIRRIKMELE